MNGYLTAVAEALEAQLGVGNLLSAVQSVNIYRLQDAVFPQILVAPVRSKINWWRQAMRSCEVTAEVSVWVVMKDRTVAQAAVIGEDIAVNTAQVLANNRTLVTETYESGYLRTNSQLEMGDINEGTVEAAPTVKGMKYECYVFNLEVKATEWIDSSGGPVV